MMSMDKDASCLLIVIMTPYFKVRVLKQFRQTGGKWKHFLNLKKMCNFNFYTYLK